MKIFYTTDGIVDEELQQVCPFGMLHYFKRDDGSEFTMPKYVGCGGCAECPYCYGRGFEGYYGNSEFVFIPKQTKPTDDFNYERNEKLKIELGLKQFNMINGKQYVRCSKVYTPEYYNKSKSLKFKVWWWHNVGIKLEHIRYKIDKLYYDTKFKIKDFFRKKD